MVRSDDPFRIECINVLAKLTEQLNGGPVTKEQMDEMWDVDGDE